MKHALQGVGLAAFAVVLLALSGWQLIRNGEAQRRAESRAAAASSPPKGPTEWPEILSTDDAIHAVVTCEFGPEVALVVASPRTTGPGHRLLKPCALPDGRRILVDVGWVMVENTAAALALTQNPPLDGLLTHPGTRHDQAFAAGPQGVPRYPPGAAASVQQAFHTLPLLLVLGESYPDEAHPPKTSPLSPGWPLAMPQRPHLGYAAFWFAAAVLLLVQVGPKWWESRNGT